MSAPAISIPGLAVTTSSTSPESSLPPAPSAINHNTTSSSSDTDKSQHQQVLAASSKMSSRSGNTLIPSDKVRLDVLLISGQRKYFDFDAQTTAKEVREMVWNDWPQDWPPRPMTPNAIRLLHLGHILEDKFVLSSGPQPAATESTVRGIPVGKSTVVHLLLRQAPTKADGDEDSLKKVSSNPGCCNCIIC